MSKQEKNKQQIAYREEVGIAVDKCRRVLGKKYEHYSDAEILQLRYVADLLVDIVLKMYERTYKF